MGEFISAISFLTRLPVPGQGALRAVDIGRATAWFPAVGLIVGASHLLTLELLSGILPPAMAGIFVLIVDVLITGALHMDGLADTADGFGGGWTKSEVLRIMGDHAIGAYGATALILCLALKGAMIATLIDAPDRLGLFLAAPVIGRWSSVVLSFALPNARNSTDSTGSVSALVGVRELTIGTTICLVVLIAAFDRWSILFAAAALLVTGSWGIICYRKIQGVTGDTLGASIAVNEIVVLFIGVVGIVR